MLAQKGWIIFTAEHKKEYSKGARNCRREALKLQPDDPAALLPLAGVLCSRHQFREGMALAKKAFEIAPDNFDALAIVGDAQMELGDYDGAGAAYRQISPALA